MTSWTMHGKSVPVHMQVYGIASEDMDSLTFATPKLVRNLMKPQTQNLPINEYDYDKVSHWCPSPSFFNKTACFIFTCKPSWHTQAAFLGIWCH